MRILVADDSSTSLAMTVAAIKKLGHDAIPASSGAEAVKLFAKNKPDLVVLDVVMEHMDGFECAREIRKLCGDDWIPIIFLSASVDDASIAKGIEAGGDDYLTKPFSEVTLDAKIKAMQRIADMREKIYESSKKLMAMTVTDPLTGVYNRLMFERTISDLINRSDNSDEKIAVLFIDLDNFKGINDTFGHHVGDLLLIEVAKRLKSNLRATDFIARLGGDEFAVILFNIDTPEEAGIVAENIIKSLSKDCYIEDKYIRSGVSVGIACYPYHGTNIDNIVHNADFAMYCAKELGKNNYQYFTEELNERYRNQLNIEYALKFALERGEFYMTYQPIYSLETAQIVGFEALICWESPLYGKVCPGEFIPIAEEAGLINNIGNWVMETACREFSQLVDKDSNLTLCINISSKQLMHADFFDRVKAIMTSNDIPLHQIEFELTESVIMNAADSAFKSTIAKLNESNINISIDDFGTGYSSLLRLRSLPIKTLKIDKSFVQDAVSDSGSATIVSFLIALGKDLKLNVIAEGIETEKQLQFLRDRKCPQGQGFYLSKAFRIAEIKDLLMLEEQKAKQGK